LESFDNASRKDILPSVDFLHGRTSSSVCGSFPEGYALFERMKGKAFPSAPTGCSPPPFLLPYGSQGEAAGAVLPLLWTFFPEEHPRFGKRRKLPVWKFFFELTFPEKFQKTLNSCILNVL